MSTVYNAETSAPVLEPQPEPAGSEKSTYSQILKSSALVGGSQLLNIVIGIVRTKVIAVLLGPAGTGLFGLYNSIADLAQSVAGMGLNGSGVRQIAEAAGCDDRDRIGRTTAVLRRMSIVLGLLGTVLLIALSGLVSTATFGSSQHIAAVSLLSIAVFFRVVSAGQGALIQGMRRVSDLAKMGVLGALAGTLISIPIVYFLREKGIVPSLIAIAAVTTLTSSWYSHKIAVQTPSLTLSDVRHEGVSLLKLGFAFMASAMMTMGAAYAVRITVLQKVGFEATGLYQAAWTLGGLYVAFILQAMGADFYPRLTACANDHLACNRMVNEQARIGLLLAGPGVIATLTFAHLVLALFYSPKFGAAVGVLRWICLGATLRVITWPMGYIILAKGNRSLLFFSELAWTIVHLGLAWICLGYLSLSGAGVAFFGSYVFHGCFVYSIVSRLTGFSWSLENKRMGLFFLPLIAAVFCGCSLLPALLANCVGTLAFIACCIYSVRAVLALDLCSGRDRWWLQRLRLVRDVTLFGADS